MAERVGIRALRAGLAAALRRAEAGERLVITVGGRPVAQLGPLEAAGAHLTIDDLASRGLIVRARREDRPPPDVRLDPWPGFRLDRLVAEVRS
ncbi:MAG: type II toxin-antitoxin system prevent-host-death family antitoxin [Actinobacteria bacterium]|nr:type II toxin-antitoxin system prevent-host-death family antitoxin [Actinomycetota bacterium]